MEATRLTGMLGARIDGIDVRVLDDAELAELRALACEHEVVCVTGQSLTPLEQVEFIKVLKEAVDGNAFNFGGAWHSDFSFQPNPPSFTVLHALDIPPYGGDTCFSSMTRAYDALSPRQKEDFLSLRGVHTARDAYSPRMQAVHSGLSGMNIVCDESAHDVTLHPLVRVHPETGRTVLFYNRAYVRDIVGIEDEAEKNALMEWLHLHTTDARFGYRHRWSPGDLLIWDNRSTQHYALNDYAGFRRELHRTTVAGEIPIPA
jgi:taurine dioxygenase